VNKIMDSNCEQIRELLNAYLDKLVSEEEKELVETHLSKCNNCLSELQLLKETSLLLKNMERAKLPDGFEYLIKTRIKNKYNKPFWNLFLSSRLINFPFSKQISFILIFILIILSLIVVLEYSNKKVSDFEGNKKNNSIQEARIEHPKIVINNSFANIEAKEIILILNFNNFSLVRIEFLKGTGDKLIDEEIKGGLIKYNWRDYLKRNSFLSSRYKAIFLIKGDGIYLKEFYEL